MKKRTTKYYLNRFGLKIVVWRKEHRPVYRPRVTNEQIQIARMRMIECQVKTNKN
jgi:hypothetical protein